MTLTEIMNTLHFPAVGQHIINTRRLHYQYTDQKIMCFNQSNLKRTFVQINGDNIFF